MGAWEVARMTHVYSQLCGCELCELETALQRKTWGEAKALCTHREISGSPCEICIDVASGADSEDPMLHALGVVVAGTIKRNFT